MYISKAWPEQTNYQTEKPYQANISEENKYHTILI